MKKTNLLLTAITFLLLLSTANASTFTFDGVINYHTDVVSFNFSLLNDATNVRVWTDSFQSGANFDPITALWTGGGALIAQNDDNPSVNPATQTYYDSGFVLPTLGAGNYIFTVATFANWANGTMLSDGFTYDNDNPIPIEQWWVDAPGYYRVNFDGVDNADPRDPDPVPEPSTLLLLGSGLAGLALYRRRKATK